MYPFTAYLRCAFHPTAQAEEVSLNRLAGMFDHWFRKSLPREPRVTRVMPLRRLHGAGKHEVIYDLMVMGESPTEHDPQRLPDLIQLFSDAAAPGQQDRLDPDKHPDLLALRLQEVSSLTGQRTQLKVSFRTDTPTLKRLPSPSDLLKVGQLKDANGFWLWDVCFDLTTWTENCTEAAYLLTLSELSNTAGDRSNEVNPWAETLRTRLSTAEAAHAFEATTGQQMRCVGVETVG
jgi:hypothetical protein